MRAAYLKEPGRVEVGDFPPPKPRDGQVLVRMEYASICGSDVHIVYDGFHRPEQFGQPGYPGHEGVGTVVESRCDELAPGTRVLTVPPPVPGGCFAELQAVGRQHVVELPADGDPRRLLLAQQLGTTIFTLRNLRREVTGGVAAVIGCGSAGLFFVQQLVRQGFDAVVASDLSEHRLGVAARLGASTTVRARDDSVVVAVMDATEGRGADLVIEAAGYDSCRADAVTAVRAGGTIGCFGYPERPGASSFPVDLAFRKSVTVQWRIGTQSEPGLASIRNAVEAIRQGRVEVDYCVGHGFGLEDMPSAMATARDPDREMVKVEIRIGADTP